MSRSELGAEWGAERGAEVWAQIVQLTDRLLQAARDEDEGRLTGLVAERGELIDELRKERPEAGGLSLEPAEASRLIEADRIVREVLSKMLSAAREELGLMPVWQCGISSYAGRPAPAARFLDRRG
jgi:hypothetical protein